MKEEYKTKEQLINELVEMQKRITHLEKLKEKHEQMDRALKESEEKFRTLAGQSPNMIFINKKSRVLYANKKCEEIMGYTKDEFYAPDFDYLDLISPEYIDLVRESYNQHTKGEGVAPYEFALLTKEGERVEAIITTKLIDYEGEKAILGVVTDIREYKRAEKEKEWLISAISHCNDGIAITDRKDRYIYVNEAHAQIYGYSPEELIGKTWRDLIPPEMVASLEKIIKETLHNKKVGTFGGEVPALRKDKTLLPTEVKAKALWDREGNYQGHICIVRDISERKRAEQALRRVEQIQSVILDGMSEQVTYQDTESRILWANRAAAESLHLTPQDLLGKYCYKISKQGDKPCPCCPVQKSVKTGQPEEGEVISPDGEIWFVRGYPVKDAKGKVIAIIEVTLDITKHRKAEEAVRESEKMYKTLTETSPEAVTVIDLEGKIIYLSQRAVGMYGAESAEGIIGRSVFEFFTPEEREKAKENFQKTLKEGFIKNLEYTLVKKDGTRYIGGINISLIKDVSGKPKAFIATTRDITEWKKAQEMLRESEMRYRATIDSMADPIHVVDRDLKFVLFNKAFTKWNEELGLEKDVLGRQLFKVFPFLSERVRDEYRRVFETGEVLVTEERTEFGGKKFITETRKIPVFDEGKITRVVTVIIDITEQKRTGNALRKSEERYRLLFEKSKDVIYITTLEGKLVDINPAGVELFGYSSKDELLNINIGKELYFNPDDRQKFQQVIEKQDYVKDFELILKKKNGEKIVVLVTSTSIRDEKGNIIGYQGIMRDITEHKRDEETLIESEEKYRILINNIQDGVFIIQDAKVQFVNEAFTKIFGYTTEELLGKDFRQLIAPEDLEMVTERYFRRQAGDDVPREYEFRVLHKDGITRVTVNMTVGLVTYRGRIASMGTLKDITARKRAEESHQESFENLRKVLQGTILAMAKIVEIRDPYTAGHQQRVAKLSSVIAQEMGLSAERIDSLQMAALIHDVGKIYIPAEILSRPGQLSEIETSLIKTHPQVGYDILRTIEFLWPVVEIVLQHHERMNGSGYPKGLTGEDILLEAKILGVADVVEAMSFHRPYRSAMGIGKALEEISQNKGILYDPQVADICFKLFYEKGFKFE